jgi:hypothetical protein
MIFTIVGEDADSDKVRLDWTGLERSSEKSRTHLVFVVVG